jgi:hypothetical protein
MGICAFKRASGVTIGFGLGISGEAANTCEADEANLTLTQALKAALNSQIREEGKLYETGEKTLATEYRFDVNVEYRA